MAVKPIFNPLTGKLDFVQNVSGLVPYTGATANVALGTRSITASNLSGTNTGDQPPEVIVAAIAPLLPTTGLFWVDTGNHKLFIYYGSWIELHNLSTTAVDFFLLETDVGLLLETGDRLGLE